MDETDLLEDLGAEFIKGWDVAPTGSGFMVITDWQWPNRDRIEVFVRKVGDREDLFLVSDGGEIFNVLFSHGIDLGKDTRSMDLFREVAKNHGAEFADYAIVKGANGKDVAGAVRMVLEAAKDISFLLWHKVAPERDGAR